MATSSKGIVLIGGNELGNTQISQKRILELAPKGSNNDLIWTILPQTLLHQRAGHLAFHVPDEFIQCQNPMILSDTIKSPMMLISLVISLVLIGCFIIAFLFCVRQKRITILSLQLFKEKLTSTRVQSDNISVHSDETML